MYSVVTCLVISLSLWFLQGQRSAIRRHGKRLPRPPGTLPLAGNGIWFLQPRHKLLEWFVHAERQVGFSTYEISVPSLPPGIVINDPANVEHVLKSNDIFVKGDFFRIRSWDLFGNGIINADGDLWKIQRKAGLRFFSNANLKIFIDDVLPPLMTDTEQYLDDAAKRATQVDLQKILLELTTRLMGNVAYDMDMPASLPFSKSFDFASGATGERFQNPFWKIKGYLFGSSFRKAVSEVKQFSNEIVSAAVGKRQRVDTVANPLKNNLINSLLDHIPDRQIVADAAMNYLSAGRDTTAQSLTWTLYLLIRHPPTLQTLLTELHSSPFPFTYTTIQHQPPPFPYTTATFNESLRLHPPVPIELKECTTASTFPDGTTVPAGSVVIWTPWSMGRSKHIWGEDADEFRPERWLVSDSEGASDENAEKKHQTTVKTMSAYEFPVFNGGPRACLGKRMAELLGVYVVARLVWRYDFVEVGERKDGGRLEQRRSQNSLTLPMEGGLPVFVKRRQPLRGDG